MRCEERLHRRFSVHTTEADARRHHDGDQMVRLCLERRERDEVCDGTSQQSPPVKAQSMGSGRREGGFTLVEVENLAKDAKEAREVNKTRLQGGEG